MARLLRALLALGSIAGYSFQPHPGAVAASSENFPPHTGVGRFIAGRGSSCNPTAEYAVYLRYSGLSPAVNAIRGFWKARKKIALTHRNLRAWNFFRSKQQLLVWTPRGILSGQACLRYRVGGFLLCTIFAILCVNMRFSVCYALTRRRGFFIHQVFYAYDRALVDFFDPAPGRPVILDRYWSCWFEQHSGTIDTGGFFQDLGLCRSTLFGFFTLGFFTPHLQPLALPLASAYRLFRILAYRGKRLNQNFPARGQRTRSNSAVSAARGRISSHLRAAGVHLR